MQISRGGRWPHFMLLLALLILVPGLAGAQELSSDWYRQPAVSPDGETLLFVHGGDIYRVSPAGGLATPLTLDDAWDGYPVWSRDGRWIAFASDRHGNFDVYVMPAGGGEARRLTWHSNDDRPWNFSPDGQEILFTSYRIDDAQNSQFPTGAFPELYAVSVEGGTPRQVLTTPAHEASWDARGRRILYEDVKGYEDPLRKHHTSGVTRDIWMVELGSNDHRRLSAFEGEDRDPSWASDGDSFFFLSERAGDSNVFRQSLENDAPAQQLTSFERHPVRDLSVSASDDLYFSWHGDLYSLPAGVTEPVRLKIDVRIDRQEPPVTTEQLRQGITEMAVAPDGKEVAFVARGEVFVTSLDFATTKRITDTPEQERSLSFSPDGRSLLYASERDDSWNVYTTSLVDEKEEYFYASTKLEEKAVVDTGEEEFQPHFSPDGKEVAYLAERTILKVKNLDSGRVRTVLPGDQNYSYADGDQWYEWSPDGKWFAVTFLSRGRYYSENVGLVPADGSADPVDISNSGYSNWTPHWSMGGNALIWETDRYGQKNHGSWGGEFDVLGAFLNADAFETFQRSKEEREIREGRGEKDKDDGKGKKDDDEDEGEDDKDEKEVEPIEIDFDRLEQRTVRLTIHASDLGDFALTPKGDALLYLARFEKGYDLWAHDFVEESTKLLSKLSADRASMVMGKDGKTVFLLTDGALSSVSIKRDDDSGIEAGKKKSIKSSPQMHVQPDAERQAMFDHVWRQVKQKFYRADLHGVDWDYYRSQYQPKLAGITNGRDFATLLSEILGELNGSHTGGRYRPRDRGGEPTASLGFFPDYDYDGDGVRIAEVMARGPLDNSELGVEVGAVILAVDGVTLDSNTNYYQQLAGKAGQRVRLQLRQDGKTEEKVVTPISGASTFTLRYDRWVKQRRELVEKASKGRVGYVHVRGMNDRSFRTVYSEVLGRYFDAEAIIVDTRYNGGGWLHDDLVTFLSGVHYTDFAPRNQAAEGQRFFGEPGRRWVKPSAVVMSEGNYSDAHAFPWAYKELGIGPLIGMPVAGTSTAVWWERLHTGEIIFGIPQVGMMDLDDGSYLENAQLEPDYRVELDPESAARGEDPQLMKAVEVLLGEGR